MYKLCKTKKTAARQKHIEETLLFLMREKTYERITVSELCEAAGIPRHAFYAYFDTKLDVIHSMLDRKVLVYKSNVKIKDPQELESSIKFFMDYWHQEKDFIQALENNGMISLFVDALGEHAVAMNPNKNALTETERLAILVDYIGQIYLMLYWLRGNYGTSDEMAKLYVTWESEPIISRAGKQLFAPE